jgi:hypothetical protein
MIRLHAQWDRMKRLILTRDKVLAYNIEHRRIELCAEVGDGVKG